MRGALDDIVATQLWWQQRFDVAELGVFDGLAVAYGILAIVALVRPVLVLSRSFCNRNCQETKFPR